MISPKSLAASGVIPALLGSLLVTAFLATTNSFNSVQNLSNSAEVATNQLTASSGAATNEIAKMMPPSPDYYPPVAQVCSSQPVWAWFILGSLVALLIFLIWNSISRKMKGGNLE